MRERLNTKGYSLVELCIVMLVFLVVMMISSYAFEKIVKSSLKQGKIAENEIAGLVGLEIMRTDIGHAGYGLPWAFQAAPAYTEVTSSPVSGFEVDATSLNDSTTSSKIPRAIVSKAGPTTGIDYLVIKGTVLGTSPTAKRWSFVNYADSSLGWWQPRNDPTTDLQTGDRVITISSAFTTSGAETRTLMGSGISYFYTVPAMVSGKYIAGAAYQPADPSETVISYGISDGNLGMPYNRVDFFVDRNAPRPASCAPGTGVLYKAVANHSGGFDKYPLLDCVGDMQIVYDRDQAGDGSLSLIDDTVIAGMTDADIHTQIKDARVYVLTHEGKKDTNFSYPPLDATNAVCVAPMIGSTCSSSGKLWTQAAMTSIFGTSWKNYRWKVYSFTVILKNLQ